MRARTILVVDDEPDIRRIAELSLTRIGGFRVLLASCAKDAMTLATERQPDLILLDVMMPGVDGPNLLARLRADARTFEIPVVFMTAKTQRAEVTRYRALGAVGVLTKPFDPINLPDELRSFLGEL